MILRDFESGGFPITRRSPVICTLSDGSVKVAYNRFDLKNIILSGMISAGRTAPEVISCVGMWPGKKNTDCFILNTDAYKIAPPERYKDIDNAIEIKIYNDPNGSFMKVTYKIIDKPLVESTDKELLKYIKAVGLKHQNLFAKGEL
jgi:hypothetical protein